jgi:hypothetical protein
MKRFSPTLCLAPVVALVTAACGSGLSGSTDKPSTIATVHGQIDNPLQLPLDSTPFRVAIVWGLASSDGGVSALRTAEDIAVTPAFPAQYQLDVTELPPPEAMSTFPGTSLRFAYGSIVAYEDTNRNGKLDLIDPNATTAIDRVLAVPTDYTLVYFEGDPSVLPNGADDNGVKPTAGFLFDQVQPLGEWACTGGPIIDGVTPPSCPGFLWKPISTPLTLTLSASPELSSYMCGSEPGAGTSVSGTSQPSKLSDFNGTLPAKSDRYLGCAPDGQSFSYEWCMEVPGKSLCDVESQCTQKSYAYDPSFASSWPCPMK